MCEIVWKVCYVKNLHKLFMCEWNDEIWIIIVYVWIDLNSLNILNKLNKFLNRLNRFLNRFLCVNRLNRFFLWNFCEIWTDFVVIFKQIEQILCEQVEQIFLWSFCEIWIDFVTIF